MSNLTPDARLDRIAQREIQSRELSHAAAAYRELDRQPVTASIMLALQRKTGDVLRRHLKRKQRIEAIMNGQDLEHDPSDDQQSLIAVGETIVGNALCGDLKAAQIILDRTEGIVHMPLDPAQDGAVRATVTAAIETAVRAMSGDPGVIAQSIKATVIDAEE